MVCGFIGHRDAPSNVKQLLNVAIDALIERSVKKFYVGNNGNFDLYAQQVLEERKSQDESLNYGVLLSFPWEKALSGKQERTLYPEGLEKVPFRFAISKRNDFLLKNSDIMIVYLKDSFSNSYKWAEKARKTGKKIINLADIQGELTISQNPLDKLK